MMLHKVTLSILKNICKVKIRWLLILYLMHTISDGESVPRAKGIPPCTCRPIKNPKTLYTAPQLIQDMGYNVEVHTLATSDGYILEMHRILPANSSKHQTTSSNRHASENESMGNLCKGKGGHVAFLMHGLLGSSADFIMNDPDQALGYIMADAGWDVWLGNVRGNTYSRKHKNLDPDKDIKFWDFSWDTIGRFDLPAMLGYVLHHTGVSKLDYVGYSMGTRTFYAMMHYHPYLKSWINVMVSLAPDAYINHMPGTNELLFRFANIFDIFVKKARGVMESSLTANCPVTNTSSQVCVSNINQLVYSWIGENADPEFKPIIDAHNPAGTSVRTGSHYGQLISSHGFKAYNFGKVRNLLEYGTVEAPDFDLQRVQVPVALYWSDKDTISVIEDVKRLASELPNVIVNHQVKYKGFGHMDFLWADYATSIYYHLMRTLINNSCYNTGP